MELAKIAAAVRDVPDFPKPGIVFKDISPVLQQADLFHAVIERMAAPYLESPPDRVMAIDARGFVFGAALAYRLGTGLGMIRKKGKLPWDCEALSYDLEYGTNTIELQRDAVSKGDRVLLVDDVLATGGTAKAAATLIETLGGRLVAIAFFLELTFLDGRRQLGGHRIDALLTV